MCIQNFILSMQEIMYVVHTYIHYTFMDVCIYGNELFMFVFKLKKSNKNSFIDIFLR